MPSKSICSATTTWTFIPAGQVRQDAGLAVDDEQRALRIKIDDRIAGIVQGDLIVDRVHPADAGVDFLIGDVDGGHDPVPGGVLSLSFSSTRDPTGIVVAWIVRP